MHLLLPLFSSLFYVFAALFLKQSSEKGVDVWRTAFVCNWVTAILFQGLLIFGGTVPGIEAFWKPAVVASLFVLGQLLTFLALSSGAVSVATPVISSKVVFVALFSAGLGVESVRWTLWVAAGLSCAGVAFIHWGQRGNAEKRKGVARTAGLAGLAAISYALFDVLVMRWAQEWGGIGRFLPIMLLMAGALSVAFVPLFEGPLHRIPPLCLRPLLGGSAFIAIQGFMLIITLAKFGDATAVNVVYSARGLWSVVFVWVFGHWFGNREREEEGAAVFRNRLIGASLVATAILLALI